MYSGPDQGHERQQDRHFAPARNASTNSDTLPMARVTYSLNDDALTYFSYAEGFRVGGTNILRAQSTANRKFDPDRVLNYEIGFKSTLWDGRRNAQHGGVSHGLGRHATGCRGPDDRFRLG